ncbi:MAG: hypothetical protein IKL84_05645 [Clostridia bacterium]|nr:hypothetical protein [Clostridia bacterium]
MKRLLSLVLCAAMLLCAAVACSPDTPDMPDTGDVTTLPDVTTVPPETEPPVEEKGLPSRLGENGNWWIDDYDTGVVADDGPAPKFDVSEDGYWMIRGEKTDRKASILDRGMRIEPLFQKIRFTPGELDPSTGKIVESDVFAYILNHPLKKGHTLSVSDPDFPFAIYRLVDGKYSEEVKKLSSLEYTAEEDMTVCMVMRKQNKLPLSDKDLAAAWVVDHQYGMKNVEGFGLRFTVEADTIEGGTATTRCNVFLPLNYRNDGTPTQVVIMTNGHSAYLTDFVWNGNSAENVGVVRSYLGAGFAVCVVNNTADIAGDRISDLGCPQLVSSYLKAFAFLRENLNVEEKFIVHARSFGTFSGVRLMREVPELVRCGIMTGPRVSLRDAFFGVSDRDFTAQRFGFDDQSGRVYEEDKTAGYDPLVDIQGEGYTLPPTYWVMAKNDGTTSPTKFAEDLKALGNDAEYIIHSGISHTGICTLNRKTIFEDVLAYINRH